MCTIVIVVFSDIFKMLELLVKINIQLEENCLMLKEIIISNKCKNSDGFIAPEDCPTFPLKSLDDFLAFDEKLRKDIVLKDYLVSLSLFLIFH